MDVWKKTKIRIPFVSVLSHLAKECFNEYNESLSKFKNKKNPKNNEG